jgi:hypothetical protein
MPSGKFMEDNGRARVGEKLKKPHVYAALPFFVRFGKGRKKCSIMGVNCEKMDEKSTKPVKFCRLEAL